jgi:hypothetical protein
MVGVGPVNLDGIQDSGRAGPATQRNVITLEESAKHLCWDDDGLRGDAVSIFQRELFQGFLRNVLKCGFVCGFQYYGRGLTRLVRFNPSKCTETPLVAWFND